MRREQKFAPPIGGDGADRRIGAQREGGVVVWVGEGGGGGRWWWGGVVWRCGCVGGPCGAGASRPSPQRLRRGGCAGLTRADAPHPAFGHPLPEGEGSQRRRCSFIEILLPPGEGARSADEGRENIDSTLTIH